MKNQILGLSLLSAVLAMPAATASAQGTLEDYNRAYALVISFLPIPCSIGHAHRLGAIPPMYCIIRFLLLRAGSLFPMMPTRMR